MNTQPRYLIKFQQGDLACLRERLLTNLEREQFAILLGKTHKINGYTVMTVVDLLFPIPSDYEEQSVAFLQIKKAFIHKALVELTGRYDVDTMIDVHTHPFVLGNVSFSATDDRDERTFFRFLTKTFANIHYASIVLSQGKYSARVWTVSGGSPLARKAVMKAQTSRENIASSDASEHEASSLGRRKGANGEDAFFQRSAAVLGLDVLRTIMHHQVISLVGVGGLGSIIAEHLIHMGFQTIHLIDPDVLEISNLNRIVGAYYQDAQEKRPKVGAVKRHLTSINPHATVLAWKHDVHDREVESVLALSDWIIVATDNHSSRLTAQRLSLQYFVPLLAVGVNITVNGQTIEDMSGEVITARVGDGLCLSCLKRINPTKVAGESHPEQAVREALVQRGYVTGLDIKEPAVKTLNAMVATLAVETLINQYTERSRHSPVLVYENNESAYIYDDHTSVEQRNKHCFLCNI